MVASTAIGGGKDPGILQVLSGSGETIESYGYQDLRSQFPERELSTRTPWTLEAQPTVYRGPALKDVLEKAGLGKASAIRVIAYNDFQAVLTLDEIDEYHPHPPRSSAACYTKGSRSGIMFGRPAIQAARPR